MAPGGSRSEDRSPGDPVPRQRRRLAPGLTIPFMTVLETVKTWTMMEAILSVVAITLVVPLSDVL